MLLHYSDQELNFLYFRREKLDIYSQRDIQVSAKPIESESVVTHTKTPRPRLPSPGDGVPVTIRTVPYKYTPTPSPPH
jgi:hypothetical protein